MSSAELNMALLLAWSKIPASRKAEALEYLRKLDA